MKDIQVGNEYYIQNSAYGKLWGVQFVDDGASHCNINLKRYTTAGAFVENTAQFIGATGAIRLFNTTSNFSTASQTNVDGNADTYIVGSNVTIPSGVGLRAGARYRCTIGITKTAAGTAASVVTVRIGTAASTADTSRLAFTQDVAQTAAVSSGTLVIDVLVRSQSATGVITGVLSVGGNSPGLGSGAVQTSSAFDNTAATLGSTSVIGVSINPGASDDTTINYVYAELIGPS